MEESLSPEHEHELPAGPVHLVHLSVSGESIVTDVEDRVILGLKEQGEVGGKMVVYKDFTVEGLCSQYFDQLYQARLLSWEGGLVMQFIRRKYEGTLGACVTIKVPRELFCHHVLGNAQKDGWYRVEIFNVIITRVTHFTGDIEPALGIE